MEVPLDLGINLIFHLGPTREQTAGSRGGGGAPGAEGHLFEGRSVGSGWGGGLQRGGDI